MSGGIGNLILNHAFVEKEVGHLGFIVLFESVLKSF